jgi:hypothetical protein
VASERTAQESGNATSALATFAPVLYVVAAILILGGAVFAYLRYLDAHPAQEMELTPEAKVYSRNLKLADVEMKATESYMKQQVVEIDGKISNAGDRPLETVEIYCIFRDAYGQLVLRKRLPIVSARMGGLKPGDTKSFRLPFDELPESWNQAMPNLVIAAVKFL